jgi:hypothetical protein
MKSLITQNMAALMGLLIPAGFASASDINCRGEVTWVMDYPEQCSGNTAFKTTGSNGKWICPPSDKGNALVLAALAADKEVEVYISSQNGVLDCNNIPDYTKARYVIINP